MLKTLLISASALALSAGVASAQSFGEPGRNTGTFVGTQSTANNNSIVNQQGESNRGVVTQTGGSNNASVVEQGEAGTSTSGGNDASVTQSGSGANRSLIRQIGTASSNTLYDGPNGEIVLTPSIADGYEQRATVIQINNTSLQANEAVILQGVSQLGADAGGFLNVATISQNGGNNSAGIEQGGGSDREDGRMSSRITQTGNNNIAENLQGEGDLSTIDQNGNGNSAYVNASPTTRFDGADNIGRVSDVDQVGDFNYAEVDQTDFFTESDIDQNGNNQAFVRQQVGSRGSFSQVNQQSNSDAADVTQSGMNSDSFIRQNNGNTNVAVHIQAGNRGVARTIQASFANYTTSVLNNSRIEQTSASSNAFASVGQSGSFNEATVTQSQVAAAKVRQPRTSDNGNAYRDNVTPDATVIQSSIRSKATVTQRGNGARMDSYQGYSDTVSTDAALLASNGLSPVPGLEIDSERNELTVLQDVGATNAFSGNVQGGDFNKISVTQNAADVVSRARQLGNFNTANVSQTVQAASRSVVTQTGNFNLATVNQ